MERVIDVTIGMLAMNAFRYFLIAGVAFLVFYIILKGRIDASKIQPAFPGKGDYRREIIYSVITIFIFVLVGLTIYATPLFDHILRYESIEDYGWGYWALSVLMMIFMHDTYFYWTHRAMHHPKLFRYFHKVHHDSINPSPWASYAFHPLEGVVEASIIFPIVLLIPHHTSAVLVFLFFMMTYNVYGHLGWELYPKGFNKTWIGKWVNTSVNHNQHHKHFHGNYGLYFLFWDRWLGTIRPDYDQAFDKATRAASYSA